MDYSHKPLDRETFSERITQSFPSAYLTNISIIQGVALGLLANSSFEYIKCASEFNWIVILRIAVSFLSLIIISIEYTWVIGLFRWSPRILDTIIPFALGFSEIIPMFYLTGKDSEAWWLYTAVLCLVGTLAFFNSLVRCDLHMFSKNYRSSYDRTEKAFWESILATHILSLICFTVWVFKVSENNQITILGIIIACELYLLLAGKKYMKSLHKDFGFDY